MSAATVAVYDAIRINADLLPAGHAAGYSTGSGDIPWGPAEWAAHPGAVRICQDPGATDATADVLDVESGAATTAVCARWCEAAAVNFNSARRPGQRHPAIYCSASTVTLVVNALVAARVVSGAGLWVADWNLTEAQATALVAVGSGPFPVIGCQYANRGAYDVSVFSAAWLGTVSGDPTPPPPSAPAPAPGWTETLVNELPQLVQGAAGEDARTLQGALIARHQPVTVDGVFGPATRIALVTFQRAAGLTPDGICGKLTWAKALNR